MHPMELFRDALSWLEQNYQRFHFFVERDVVWTLQKHLLNSIEQEDLPYRVFHGHSVLPSKRESLSADLAILGSAW